MYYSLSSIACSSATRESVHLAVSRAIQVEENGSHEYSAKDRNNFKSLVWAMPLKMLQEVGQQSFKGELIRSHFFLHSNTQHPFLVPLVPKSVRTCHESTAWLTYISLPSIVAAADHVCKRPKSRSADEALIHLLSVNVTFEHTVLPFLTMNCSFCSFSF